MTDSPFLNEHILKGKEEGPWEVLQQNVTRVLQRRFQSQVAEEILTRVSQETNLTLLQDWLDLAYEAPTWQTFRTKFKQILGFA